MLGTRCLQQVQDLLHDLVAQIRRASSRRRPLRAASQQAADHRPPRIRRAPPQAQRIGDHAERVRALKRMSLTAKHHRPVGLGVADQALH